MWLKRKAKSDRQKAAPPGKITLCLKCTAPQTIINLDKKCMSRNCNGDIFTFDSKGEGLRYVDLWKDKYISDLQIQKKYDNKILVAKYSVNRGEPELIGYHSEPVPTSSYKLDFFYYDTRTYKGWVSEEFKSSKKDTEDEYARIKMKMVYDQHHEKSHFCFSFPERNGLDMHKRLFFSYQGENVRYKTLEEKF